MVLLYCLASQGTSEMRTACSMTFAAWGREGGRRLPPPAPSFAESNERKARAVRLSCHEVSRPVWPNWRRRSLGKVWAPPRKTRRRINRSTAPLTLTLIKYNKVGPIIFRGAPPSSATLTPFVWRKVWQPEIARFIWRVNPELTAPQAKFRLNFASRDYVPHFAKSREI